MPQSRECDYCGADIEPGTGTMFVRTNGSTVHYCSAKCEKNADLGREARDLEWTAAGQAAGGETVTETAADEVDPETVEEVDEREDAGTTPDLEEAEAEAAEEAAADADEADDDADEAPSDEAEESEADSQEADVDEDAVDDAESADDESEEETEEAEA